MMTQVMMTSVLGLGACRQCAVPLADLCSVKDVRHTQYCTPR